MRLLDALQVHGDQLGAKPALIDDLGEISYADLAVGVRAGALMLAERGVREGDVVGLALEPTAPGVVLLLASMAVGAIAAPINVRLTSGEIADYLGRITPALILIDPASGVRTHEGDVFEHLHTAGSLWDRLSLRPTSTQPPAIADDRGAIAFPTGGTTGIPKAAVWSRAGLSDIIVSNCIHLRISRLDRELYLSPLFHINLMTGILSPLYVGATVRLAGRFDAGRVAAMFPTFQPTRLFTIPTALDRVMDHLEPGPFADHELTVTYGAASSAPNFRERLRSIFPRIRLISGYGATEFGPVLRLYDSEPEAGEPGVLGRPVAGARVSVLTPDGLPVPSGDVGEIVVRAPWQMIGYLGGDDSPFESDGSIRSGDLGWQNPLGCLFFSGRRKELIKSGGENVHPNEVEHALAQHAAVADVAAYGVSDAMWGERVEAAVVLRPGMSVDGPELREFCRSRIAGYKIPKRFRFVDAIPYTPNLKVARAQLVAAAEAEATSADHHGVGGGADTAGQV